MGRAFDSSVEETLAEKFGETRDGWRLRRVLPFNRRVLLRDLLPRLEAFRFARRP